MPETVSNDAPVIDLALFSGPQRTLAALRNSAVIADDEQQSGIRLLERINRAAAADGENLPPGMRSELAASQAQFREKLASLPYAQLVEEGHVNALVEKYLDLLARASAQKLHHLDYDPLSGREETSPTGFNQLHKQAEEAEKKYTNELAYYRSNPQAIKDVALAYEAIVRQPDYLPVARIVAQSGITGRPPEYAADLTSDVLGVVAARNLDAVRKLFADDEAMARYAENPAENNVRIRALAENIAQATQPLSALREFEPETPELDRILALKLLLSAQLHHAITQEREPEQLITVEREARKHAAESSQAALSLAYHYLENGAAKDDQRILTVKANLQKEMETLGVSLLPPEEAVAAAAALARRSAEDLLQAAQGDAQLTEKISVLARAAGVAVEAEPLKAKSQLIGEDLIDLIREKMASGNVIVPKELKGFVSKENGRRAEGSPPVQAL